MTTSTTQNATPAVAVTEDRLLTISELAERLGVSVSTIRRLIRDGAIPAVRIRRAVRFRFEDVVEALSEVDPRP